MIDYMFIDYGLMIACYAYFWTKLTVTCVLLVSISFWLLGYVPFMYDVHRDHHISTNITVCVCSWNHQTVMIYLWFDRITKPCVFL